MSLIDIWIKTLYKYIDNNTGQRFCNWGTTLGMLYCLSLSESNLSIPLRTRSKPWPGFLHRHVTSRYDVYHINNSIFLVFIYSKFQQILWLYYQRLIPNANINLCVFQNNSAYRAHRFPLHEDWGKVKLPVGQVDLNRFFLFISYKQIEEFQNFWSRASDDFEKRQALAHKTGIILGMGSANERRCYNVASSLIGWSHTQNASKRL